AVFLMSGLAVWLLLRWDELRSFKLGPLSAELKEKVVEVDRLIRQLRSLAIAVAEPAVLQLALGQGSFRHAHLGYRDELFGAIVDALEEVGVQQEKIDVVSEAWCRELERKHVNSLLALDPAEREPDVEAERASLLKKLDESGAGELEVYERFLERRGLLDAVRQEKLADLRHFRKTRRLRRPMSWPVGS
ncbi:MAG: hypothetical protein ACE5GX_19180, partial [Thermoanaerobaculia bacterium]